MDSLTQAVVHNVQDGDVLFVDIELVDIEQLRRGLQLIHHRFQDKSFLVVPVQVPKGKTVLDCIAVARKETQ